TLLKQQIPDKPTWLLSSGCSRFVRLCNFDFLYPVRRTTSKPRCEDSFPRCNVKNNAFAALKLYYSITWCMCVCGWVGVCGHRDCHGRRSVYAEKYISMNQPVVDENTNSEMFRTISTRL
ncbi:hypothetical protein ALC57_18863, partial [Trachymyrmex cornetzi]